MQTEIATIQEAALQGWTHTVTVDHDDLTAAGLTQTLALLNVQAGDIVDRVGVELVTPFVGASVTALFVTVGDGTDNDLFIGNDNAGTPNAEELESGSTPISVASDEGGQGTLPQTYTAADTVDGFFTAVGANLSVLTAGKVIFRFRVLNATGAR